MYQIIECDQRSDEWFKARLGKFTASVFSKVITASGKKSESSEDLINRLVAELVTGSPDDTFQSEAMARGSELEGEALNFLNFTHDLNFQPCGFIDSGLGYGCSPDAIDLDAEIGLEMKIPSAHTHVEYVSSRALPKKYFAQTQGSMMVTGFKRWAFFSYHPEIKPLLIIVERDEAFISALTDILAVCCLEVQRRHRSVREHIEG